MRITVETIDAGSMQLLGYTPMPSYVVVFAANAFRGQARFVPALEDANRCLGQVFDVEVNQERVTALQTIGALAFSASVHALSECCAFHVQGVVTHVAYLSEPAGVPLVVVSACGADFMLGRAELGDMKLSMDERVSFVAHGLSLWDEAL